MKKILIVEDDKYIHQMLEDLLRINNYESVNAFSGTEALIVCNDEIDLVILDLMLPGRNGQEVISEIKEKYNIPIIVLTAMSDLDTKLDLFELGADDYITKPFENDELLARIKVQERHYTGNSKSKNLVFKDIKLSLNDYGVICNNQSLAFSKIEFELLKVLMSNPKQVFTKTNLFDLVWNDEDSADDNTLNVHISKIRNKLKKANPNEEYIETIWAIGYKMKN